MVVNPSPIAIISTGVSIVWIQFYFDWIFYEITVIHLFKFRFKVFTYNFMCFIFISLCIRFLLFRSTKKSNKWCFKKYYIILYIKICNYKNLYIFHFVYVAGKNILSSKLVLLKVLISDCFPFPYDAETIETRNGLWYWAVGRHFYSANFVFIDEINKILAYTYL